MNLLNNMKIGNRLLLGFGIIGVLLVIMAVLAVWGVQSVNNSLLQVSTESAKMLSIREAGASFDSIIRGVSYLVVDSNTGNQQKYQNDIQAARDLYGKTFADVQNFITSEEGKTYLVNLENSVAALKDVNNEAINLAIAGQTTEAAQVYVNDIAPGKAKVDEAVAALLDWQHNNLQTAANAARDTTSFLTTLMIIAAIVVLLLAVVLAIAITRSITTPVQKSAGYLGEIAKGDFTILLEQKLLTRKDEMGDIMRAVSQVLNNMRGSLSQVRDGIGTLASASTELSAISAQMQSTAAETSSKSNLVAAAAEEMSANTGLCGGGHGTNFYQFAQCRYGYRGNDSYDW